MSPPTSYYILDCLAKREMTGYELTCALASRHARISVGDGYLYPILFLLEQQGLLLAFDGLTADGEHMRLHYQLTPLGMLQYETMRARVRSSQTVSADGEEILPDAPPERVEKTVFGISSLPETLTREVPRHARHFFTRALSEHIDDALATGMSTATLLTALGDPDDLTAAMQDAARALPKAPPRGRKLILGIGLLFLFAALFMGMLLLSAEFAVDILIGVGVLLAVVLAYRVLRIYGKRCRAWRMMKRAAKASGCTIRREQWILFSLLPPRAYPTVVIEGREKVYRIRFVSSWQRRRILQFQNPYLWRVIKVKGVAMLATARGATITMTARPNGMHPRYLRYYHTEIVKVDSDCHSMPLMEKRFDAPDRPCLEVILLNPAPMKATYLTGNTEHTLVGGEIFSGVLFHDAPGFCAYLTRAEHRDAST